jgi:hypothetical protein
MRNVVHTGNTCTVGWTNFTAILEPGDARECRRIDSTCRFTPCFQTSALPSWFLEYVEWIELFLCDLTRSPSGHWYIDMRETSPLREWLIGKIIVERGIEV